MKKIMLTTALVITLCNLTVGIAYAAVCRSTSGARSCGSACTTVAGGTCGCVGDCTSEERDWVAAGTGKLVMMDEGDY